jgi:DNA modification methylase
VPVHVALNLTPAQVKAYRIMDNRSHQEAEWDLELLVPEISELQALSVDLALTGFNLDELDEFLAKADAAPGLTDDDACPEVLPDPISVLGDVWLLGRHRLMCGDSTSIDAVDKLMAGEKADLVFTDPPYNLDYEGYTKEKLTIRNDSMSDQEFNEFLASVFKNYCAAAKNGASFYVCHSAMKQREFQDAMEAAGLLVRCQIVWVKNTFAWGFSRYKWRHEPIFYCYKEGKKDPWYDDKSQSTVWEEKKHAANRLHPTMKPVELIERALGNSSKSGDAVLDLFGGSGSTLIACEKTGRNARLMELDPQYCNVIVRRWQEFTGKQATLEGDGRTFDAVENERLGVTLGGGDTLEHAVLPN